MKKLYPFLTIGGSFTPRFIVLVFFTSLFGQSASAQNCPFNQLNSISSYPNTYFPGSQPTVTAGSKSIVLGAASYGTTPISQGDILLVIQMQGTRMNYSNNGNYGAGTGTGTGYLNNFWLLAGNMEYVVAANNLSMAGGTLQLVSGLVNNYYEIPFGSDGQFTYQVIRVPIYYDLKLTNTINPPRWDGSSGGVLVLYATDNIDMNFQTIDASGYGFRGGGGRDLRGGAGAKTDFITLSSNNANGSKGEGIAGTPMYVNENNTVLGVTGAEGYPGGSYAMGAPANAGGGGTDATPNNNAENTGGGGGANGGSGGYGGYAWNSGTHCGGRPGSPFTQGSASRLIMGGGGGAGTNNDGTGIPAGGLASSGAAGGGIVILTAANSIIGVGTVLANGVSGNITVQNDGAGGGGAGGTILIYSNNGALTNITAQAFGGTGGSNEVGGGPKHGPGGGGGGGVIYSNSVLSATSTVQGGNFGTTAAQSTNYGATSGSNGIMVNNMNPSAMARVPLICVSLPVTFLNVTAEKNSNSVNLNWEVAQEVNTLEYIIERSTDGLNFSTIGSTPYKNGSAFGNTYAYTDNNLPAVSGSLYYRIRELDTDGKYVYSKIVSVLMNNLSGKFSVYPNPAHNSVTVSFICTSAGPVSLRLFDIRGSLLWQQLYTAHTGQNNVEVDNIRNIPTGTYILQWFDGLSSEQVKVMVTH